MKLLLFLLLVVAMLTTWSTARAAELPVPGARFTLVDLHNEATLQSSNLGVVVVALYALPVLSGNRRQAIRLQIADAENFCRTHPEWLIARSPDEARAAHLAGKRVMVLSLEGASGILEHESDFREFIDQGGIRIVTFAHITNDHLTGAALMKGYRRLSSPWEWTKSLFAPHYNAKGILVSSKGLTSRCSILTSVCASITAMSGNFQRSR